MKALTKNFTETIQLVQKVMRIFNAHPQLNSIGMKEISKEEDDGEILLFAKFTINSDEYESFYSADQYAECSKDEDIPQLPDWLDHEEIDSLYSLCYLEAYETSEEEFVVTFIDLHNFITNFKSIFAKLK